MINIIAGQVNLAFESAFGYESGSNMIRFLPCSLAALLFASVAFADEAVTRGEAVVEQWCRLCHLRASDPPDPVMAPRFEDIVRRQGRDPAYLARFLEEDHFPMTTYRLFDHEKADVVAWLTHLREQQKD